MRVAAAVSGGMDSLLALALLKEAGEEVLALHAHFLPPDGAARAREGALAAQCDRLGVEFQTVDLSSEFRERIIRPFAQEYAAGRTPNPCAACNPDMKFGLLFDHARALGAERLATGHYARIVDHPACGRALARGADRGKDQSYFLSLVPQERLAKAAFPLGGVLKKEVPAMLAARGLTPPVPTESQEICFVPGDDYCAFLEREAPGLGVELPGEGPILDRAGRALGRHRGLWRHTPGQRRGLGVAHSEPLYVLDKDPGRDALVVGPADAARAAGCVAERVNLLVPPGRWPAAPLARTRYRQEAKPCRAECDGATLRIAFAAPRSLPAPGQVAALYDEDGVVLAGGVIREYF
ncbi:MAG: tRNA 2-thiouridine(34) synthase MnmA [Thermodesulfobacteriota bacterium]